MEGLAVKDKIIKKLCVGAAVVGLLFATTGIGFAQDGYCSGVVVKEVGAKVDGGTPINVVSLINKRSDCGDWPENATYWFVLDSANADAMLAAALTAKSLGKTVTVVSKTGNVYQSWGTLIHLSVN